MTHIEAMKLALEALVKISKTEYYMERPPIESLEEKMRHIAKSSIPALRQALEQSTEQEPVAYELADKVRIDLDRQSCPGVFMNIAWESIVKNYTPQPQEATPRKPLTDEEIWDTWCDVFPRNIHQFNVTSDDIDNFARAIEAAHGITGEKE